ncbi:hypothetical protein CC78DRAFT_586508 [Lojkania enalia]|uniref:Uncharacterized protein n=1 Tax=Lojkania enalia TaxID=147567 RepID=A0A9P4MY67_9PLEO|nr:hypothetical protein CC78DRAFT_586508 [Didymosphaeria enalia]
MTTSPSSHSPDNFISSPSWLSNSTPTPATTSFELVIAPRTTQNHVYEMDPAYDLTNYEKLLICYNAPVFAFVEQHLSSLIFSPELSAELYQISTYDITVDITPDITLDIS